MSRKWSQIKSNVLTRSSKKIHVFDQSFKRVLCNCVGPLPNIRLLHHIFRLFHQEKALLWKESIFFCMCACTCKDIIILAASPRRGGVAVFATATLHIGHSIWGLNRNVSILLNMQSRSREATVTPRRRGVAAII